MMNEMDLDLDNGESEEKTELKSRELVLPYSTEEGDFVLECWKVEDGSLVRGGETVALACLARANGSSGGSTTDTLASSAPTTEAKHRRPTRRKRPTVSAPANTDSHATNRAAINGNQSHELKTIKLPPKENHKKNEKKNGETETTDSMETESRASSESSKRLSQSVSIGAPIKGFLRIGKKNEQSGSNVIGIIEPCSHPVVVDGLCGVCFDPVAQKSNGDENIVPSSESLSKSMSQVTVAGGLTFTVSEQEGQQMARQNAERLRKQRKLSLILDLDHTLVHATADMRARQHLDREDVRSLVLPITEEGEHGTRHLWMQHFVKLRPKVKEFLYKVLPLYEVGVYTAGTRQYAEQIAIVLCRHLVGAERDQIDLDQLRYEVSQAEADWKRQQADIEATRPKDDANGTDKKDTTKNSSDVNKRQHPDDENDDKDDNPDGPIRKRRKVTFAAEPEPQAAPPSETQLPESHVITAEDVKKLKTELEEAERLEKEANEMRQRLFGSRIVSRTDVGDLGRDVKSLKRIFPCGGTMAAVVDDREDVWANSKDNNNDPSSSSSTRQGEPPENLLLVRPYHWQPFVGFADINNSSGVDLVGELDGGNSQEDPTEEHDVQLLWTADVLKRLHTRYYSKCSGDEEEEVSVPQLLSDMRKEVLNGDRIVLSGLIPLHRQSQDGYYNGPRPSIVRYAECLGAKILSSVTPAVSFVIAAKDGTDKTLQARKTPGCAVVKLSFLMECFWSITRRDARPHLLVPTGREKVTENTDDAAGATRILLDDEDESDEDEDDFAAEFEKDF